MNYKVKCQLKGITAIFIWCNEQFGSGSWDCDYIDTTVFDLTEFSFSREEDLTLFTLKWL